LGSGKSTLMKFICDHPETVRGLERWSGDKTLVRCNFFFWKPGTPLQRSLLGLVRSLLHSILSQCPEAVPESFPQHWDPLRYNPWTPPQEISLGSDEILSAFNYLLSDSDIFRDHRFCFFIDGLDEFVEEVLTHRSLVDALHDWVRASEGRLKICVSSRELPSFLDRLPDNQRIRLQDLTSLDICQVIDQGLDGNDHFQSLSSTDWEGCENLKNSIAGKADGVFLWVALTLKMVHEGLEHREKLAHIAGKIDSLPQSLEDLLDFTLSSVPKDQRKMTYCFLAYAMHNIHSLDLQDLTEDDVRSLWGPMSLLRFSFLDDYIEDEQFAMRLAMCNMSNQQLEDRVKASTAQIQGRCKGLLEVRELESHWRTELDSPSYIAFTHRSIPEFLEDYLLRNEVKKYMSEFDVVAAHLQTILAQFKSLAIPTTEEPTLAHIRARLIEAVRPPLNHLFFSVNRSGVDKSRYYYAIRALDEAMRARYAESSFAVNGVWANGKIFPSIKAQRATRTKVLQTPLLTACVSCHEYVIWEANKNSRIVQGYSGGELVKTMITGLVSDPLVAFLSGRTAEKNRYIPGNAMRGKRALANILGLGFSPNEPPNMEGDGQTLWAVFLQYILEHKLSNYTWGAVEGMLEHIHDGNIPVWQPCSPCDSIIPYSANLTLRECKYLVRMHDTLFGAFKYSQTLTLRDLLTVDEEPENADRIRQLLDRLDLDLEDEAGATTRPENTLQFPDPLVEDLEPRAAGAWQLSLWLALGR